MQRARRLGLRVRLVILGLSLLAGACGGGSGGDPVAAPEFALESLSGERVRLSALRGRVVVVAFWATWCPPCLFQIPILNDLHDRYADAGVTVLGISVDNGGRGVVEAYADRHGIEYAVLLGSRDLARAFEPPGFPALAVVDREGMIAALEPGLLTEEALDTELARLRVAGASR